MEEEEVTVDQVLEEHVGSLGFSQLLHVFLVSLAWIFDSQNTLITIFTDAQPPAWRCLTPPHHDHASSSLRLQEAAAASCTAARGDRVIGDGGRGGGDVGSVCGLVPGSWEWVGGHKSSIIAEWGLFCDRKFLAALPASLFFLGSLLGKLNLPPLSFSINFFIEHEQLRVVNMLKRSSGRIHTPYVFSNLRVYKLLI